MPKNGYHAFHLVDIMPLPLTGSNSAIILTAELEKWFHQFDGNLLILAILTTILTIFQWRWDITREATYQGLHTSNVVMDFGEE